MRESIQSAYSLPTFAKPETEEDSEPAPFLQNIWSNANELLKKGKDGIQKVITDNKHILGARSAVEEERGYESSVSEKEASSLTL